MNQPTEWARGVRVFFRIFRWAAAFAAFLYLSGYAFDVNKRITRKATCQWIDVSNPDDMPYTARYCHLTKDTGLLQLYDVKGQRLLAERMYSNLDLPRLYWGPDALNYDTSTGESIALPPTLLDKLRAKLP